MSQQTIAKNEYYELHYHPEDKIIHHVFTEKLGSEQFVEVLERGTEVLEEYAATKWLADNRRQVNVLTDEDNAWATNVWFPQTKELGWKYWAILVSDTMENRSDLVRYVQYYCEQGIMTRIFSDEQSAIDWLMSVEA